MHRLRICLPVLALLAALALPQGAQAQFRNHGIFLPQGGYMSLELMGDFGTTDAGFFGVGGMSSVGYNFWFTYRLWVGFCAPSHDAQEGDPTLLTTLSIMPGIRYNFLDEEWRPYAEFDFQYLWFLYSYSGLRTNPALGDQAMYGAPRLAAGLEWFFYEEMSIMIEAAGHLYVTLGTVLDPGISALVGYTVYW